MSASRRYAFITTGVNCQPWLWRCLDSIDAQEYRNFTVHVVDDATDDEPYRQKIQAVCDERGWMCTLNTENMGTLYNQVHAIRALNLDDDDVIVWCDADDRLKHSNVLDRLNQEYDIPGMLLTYGSYESEPFSPTCNPAQPYPDAVIRRGTFRKWTITGGGIMYNHLRTMKHRVFAAMDDSDFQNPKGVWLKSAPDSAIMYPGLELAGQHHSLITDVLYVYNSENPNSDWRRQPRQVDEDHGWILKPWRRKQPLRQ